MAFNSLRTLLVMALASFFFTLSGCKKDDVIDDIDTPPGAFTAYVTLRTESTANIEWSKADDPDGDTIKYSILLEGAIIDTNLRTLQYQFSNLQDSKEYKGFVVASDPDGDTSMAGFTLPPFEGWVFGRISSGLGCVSLSTGSVKWSFNGNNAGFYAPVIVGDTIFAVDGVGELFALNHKTGSLIWRKQPPMNHNFPYNVHASPAYENGRLVTVVQTDSMAVSAFRSSDGAVLWQYKASTIVQTAPTIVNGIVYFSTNGHTVYALDVQNGSVKWSYNTNVNYDFISAPTVAGNMVYFGSSFGKRLYALNATTGALVWRFSASGPINFDPRIENGVLYIASEDGEAYAFNAQNGQIIWQNYLPVGAFVSHPSIDEKHVYYGCDGNILAAYRKSDGQRMWTASIYATYTNDNNFIAANGRVYSPNNSEIQQFQASDGKRLDPIPRKISAPVFYINKKVYYPSTSGMLQ